MFANARGEIPKTAHLGAILEGIRTGRWRHLIELIRQKYQETLARTGNVKEAKNAIAEAKKKLPTFCISGTAKDRKTPLEHSGLLTVDVDGLGARLPALREELMADPHIAFGFVSPSGDGLKCGLRIDGARHAESFSEAQRYFRQRYDVEVDPLVKDRLRLSYVSFDPDVWSNTNAQPLPLPASTGETDLRTGTRTPASGGFPVIVLPSGSVSLSDSARDIFTRIAPSHTLFWRGGALVELVTVNGVPALAVVSPDAFRSRVEKVGKLFAWRTDGKGNPVLKPSKMAVDDAKAILASTEARELLPSIGCVVSCPVITETPSGDAVILGGGYHPELGGLLVVGGATPPQLTIAEAVGALRWLFEEFDFQSEGDRSRAIAAIFTPALRIGGFLLGPIPVDVAESDVSQAGKGYRHDLTVALYNEGSYFVTARNGGVGSVDESFGAALVAGRPFIRLDNIRGKLDSQHLEAFLTCSGPFPARIPHRGEALVDTKRFILQMSSNGLEATRDLTNRASICRIRKRPGYAYRDTLAELKRRQPYFLGALYTLIKAWMDACKPRSKDCRHDFREWAQILDWIVQNLFHCVPLMEGHQAAQERASNPALSWLRALALAVEKERRLELALMASDLVEICELHGVEIPGKPADQERAQRQVGSLCKRLFRDSDALDVDGFTVTRAVILRPRAEGGPVDVKTYTFAKPHQAHQAHQDFFTP